FVDVACPAQQGMDVQSHQRRRNQSHRGQNAEPPADVRRNKEQRIFFLACNLQQVSFFRIGNGNELRTRSPAKRLAHPLTHDQERAERFRGAAGFGDHAYRGALGVEQRQCSSGRPGIHVVQHYQPRAAGQESKTRLRFLPGGPRLIVLDNVDPGPAAAALALLNPKRTAVCVIAKSGSTAETLSTFLIVREWMRKSLGRRARAQFIAITDPEKGDLLQIAREEKYSLFFIPSNVGGRFSVLSPVGLVPAALMGLDIHALLRGARDVNELCWQRDPRRNPALASALVHHALDLTKGKTIEVVFAYSSYLWGTAFWYRQLWAESLGKHF